MKGKIKVLNHDSGAKMKILGYFLAFTSHTKSKTVAVTWGSKTWDSRHISYFETLQNEATGVWKQLKERVVLHFYVYSCSRSSDVPTRQTDISLSWQEKSPPSSNSDLTTARLVWMIFVFNEVSVAKMTEVSSSFFVFLLPKSQKKKKKKQL